MESLPQKLLIPLSEIEIIELPEIESSEKIININIGILGHVDSGKTTLSKLLSSIASTAAFDKNPQSKERGITLDLGFSALYLKTPISLKKYYPNNNKLNNSDFIQITIVDCPGHASLIKTIIAGSSIIDTMILVIDAIKGIQVQTIECVVLSEILCEKITVALNKIDLTKNEDEIKKKIKALKNNFAKTKFGNDIPIIPISSLNKDDNSIKNLLMNVLCCINFDILDNKENDNLLAFVDHCFKIKNKGTIITGTIIKGNIKVNDEVYFPELMEKKQVKEIQIFRKSVKFANKGDRVGMLIKNLDKEKLERTIICSPSSNECILSEGGLFFIKKINLFKSELISGNKYYLMIGNQGVNAKCLFFSNNDDKDIFINFDMKNIKNTKINIDKFYSKEYSYISEIKIEQNNEYELAFIKFDQKTIIPNNMIFLGSKIDIDITQKTNRLAFYGKMFDNNIKNIEDKLKIFKNKFKEGKILRLVDDDNVAIVKGLFKKDNVNISNNFIGKEVHIKEDEKKEIIGKILSTFGQSGKIKIEFNKKLSEVNLKDSQGNNLQYKNFNVELQYKKYIKLDKF